MEIAIAFSKNMSEVDTLIYSQKEKTPYEIWLELCNERDLLEDVLDDIFKTSFSYLTPINILDIGCAVGSAAQRLVNTLHKHQLPYQYTGIDPYQEQLDCFAANDTIVGDKRLVKSTLESFEPDQKFDLAYAVHILYYPPDLEKALLKINMLADRAIIVHHGKSGINTVQTAFRKYVKSISPTIISTYQEITGALNKLGIDYKLYKRTASIDISPCKDPENIEGRKLISFFLEDTTLPKEVYSEVSLWMKENLPDTLPHDIGIITTKKANYAKNP